MKYTFTAEGADKLQSGTSKICGIYDDFTDPEYAQKQAKGLGQLKALFGEPLYISENCEEQFSYCISAASEDNRKLYFEVYSGPSGLSIGGRMDELSKNAANLLAEYICSAETVDYDYTGYYMDGPCKIEQGIKDGVPYYHEEELVLSEEEFKELYQKLYNL